VRLDPLRAFAKMLFRLSLEGTTHVRKPKDYEWDRLPPEEKRRWITEAKEYVEAFRELVLEAQDEQD
jgi:hypothetical protein